MVVLFGSFWPHLFKMLWDIDFWFGDFWSGSSYPRLGSLYFTGRMTLRSDENGFGLATVLLGVGTAFCISLACKLFVVCKKAISFSPNRPTRALFFRYFDFFTFGLKEQSFNSLCTPITAFSSSFFFLRSRPYSYSRFVALSIFSFCWIAFNFSASDWISLFLMFFYWVSEFSSSDLSSHSLTRAAAFISIPIFLILFFFISSNYFSYAACIVSVLSK